MNRDFTPFRFRPIVIIGAPRSGTNMLRDALTSCDRAATWPCDEINAVWRHHNARFPSDELQPAQATRSVKRYVRRAFQRLAHRTGAKWIVEKTCANSLRVDFVRAIIPEAKFIFLVRDGYDVTASSMKRWTAPFDVRYTLQKARYVPLDDIAILAVRFVANRLYRIGRRDGRLSSWGPTFDGMQEMVRERSLAEVCAEQWSRCVRNSAAALTAYRPDQVCFVRYETLVGNPQRELHRVAGF
ncbi:MAG TPA: sulfotransferase, partial [Lacipirellulaceae bacterium]|nr:sulfotransferase [Lacipirellulaceae bacterium]